MRPEQIRGWIYKLNDTFKKICIEKNISLQQPIITVSPLKKELLGCWNKEKREICLSVELVSQASLSEILEVFKHEMAHQAVDEILCRRDNRPHGELFAEACGILDISPQASFKLSNKTDKQILKIEKLLALSTSMNQHEAEAALAKAQELSFKYNAGPVLDSAPQYSVRHLGEIRKRIAGFEWKIMNILSEFYFVKTLKIFHLDEIQGRTLWQFEIYGTPHNIDTAEYVYYFLMNNAELLWKDYRQLQGAHVSRMRNSYMNGIFDGFRHKLRVDQELLKKKYDVIRLSDPALDVFFHECNPRISHRSISCRTVAGVYSDGMKDGKKMKVRHGLKKSGTGHFGRLLTDKGLS